MYILEISAGIKLEHIQDLVQDTLDAVYKQYYYKGTHSTITYEYQQNEIVIVSSDREKAERIERLLRKNIVRKRLPDRYFITEEGAPAAGDRYRIFISVHEGLSPEEADHVMSVIRHTGGKTDSAFSGGILHITSPDRQRSDDMSDALKSHSFGFPVIWSVSREESGENED